VNGVKGKWRRNVNIGGMDLNLQQQLHRFMAEVSNGNIENGESGIYRMFRNEKRIRGTVQKPTGKKDVSITSIPSTKLNGLT
jgi:hypothetical protein